MRPRTPSRNHINSHNPCGNHITTKQGAIGTGSMDDFTYDFESPRYLEHKMWIHWCRIYQLQKPRRGGAVVQETARGRRRDVGGEGGGEPWGLERAGRLQHLATVVIVAGDTADTGGRLGGSGIDGGPAECGSSKPKQRRFHGIEGRKSRSNEPGKNRLSDQGERCREEDDGETRQPDKRDSQFETVPKVGHSNQRKK